MRTVIQVVLLALFLLASKLAVADYFNSFAGPIGNDIVLDQGLGVAQVDIVTTVTLVNAEAALSIPVDGSALRIRAEDEISVIAGVYFDCGPVCSATLEVLFNPLDELPYNDYGIVFYVDPVSDAYEVFSLDVEMAPVVPEWQSLTFDLPQGFVFIGFLLGNGEDKTLTSELLVNSLRVNGGEVYITNTVPLPLPAVFLLSALGFLGVLCRRV